MRMTRDEALRLLGLENAAVKLTEGVLTAAYRRALVACHPDTATVIAPDMSGPDRQRPLPKDLQAARDFLRQDATGQNNACSQCRGRGRVRVRLGEAPCGACNGTGQRKP